MRESNRVIDDDTLIQKAKRTELSIEQLKYLLRNNASDDAVFALCDEAVLDQPVRRQEAEAERARRLRKPNWVNVWSAIATTVAAIGIVLQLIV